ncbi:Lrp/AsnC family transcriptional regulator [Neisseria dentiae]|uniref:Lrp/AsnC family transcriptional regulator n=1 Tax=Neisseria dentiae TaxID=194197 RepID=UPI00359F30CC
MKKFDDKTSQAILRELRQNARISWQDLGRAVHLSGQAAAERVRQMQEAGVFGGYTLRESRARHFIGITMQHTRFDEFERWLCNNPNVESIDKTSGDICYTVVYIAETPEELERFLNDLLRHGSYRLNSSIRRVK